MGTPLGRRQAPVFLEGGAFLFSLLPVCLTLALLGIPSLWMPLSGQDLEWNSPRVLQMIREAGDVRQGTAHDSTFWSYSSTARGYVYFYLDREDTGERILVKTDQIALEVFWQAPDRFKQRIVGLRDEKSLPTNIRYHLDHLVVVQDEFGDLIRIGDGDEVEAVLHPAAPGSETVYDFLLADSVTLNLPATSDTVRVYEVQVRPKNFEVPGFVGSVFLDQAKKSIVRMSFTFTPASYVDPYLDHISISLENGLWMGKHWLPFRQQLEIRREVPYLDFPAGSVIRGSFEVRDYEINPPLPSALFTGGAITALPEAARGAFPFEDSLHAQLAQEGLQGFLPPPDMDEIRSLALSLAKDQYLSGLGRSRLFLPSPAVSSALRFNRAEGLFLGAGISHNPLPQVGLSLYGGLSFGRERPTAEGRVTGGERYPSSELMAFLNRPRDLGPVKAISGVLNTLAAVTLNHDFTDLFFASGAQATHTLGQWTQGRLKVTARWEQHRSARDVVSSDLEDTEFRPVLPVDEGIWTSVALAGSSQMPWPNLLLTAEGLLGRFKDQGFGSLSGGLSYRRRWLTQGAEVQTDLQGGALLGDPPLQAHYFLGGRQTLPGYPFRSLVGDGYWLLRSEASIDLLHPFLRLRAFGAAGGAREDGLIDPTFPPGEKRWSYLLSAGAGLGLGWDVVRLELARGLRDGGEWEVILSVKQDFWPWL
ncbi:MAG: hypothetical protein ABIF09_10400 [Gemmatimonadota bacterium]